MSRVHIWWHGNDRLQNVVAVVVWIAVAVVYSYQHPQYIKQLLDYAATATVRPPPQVRYFYGRDQ